MEVQVVMPQMGESIAEGTILKWKKAVGDSVAKDENILEISTDKVDSEIPSPSAGTFAKILVQEGETVVIGTPIAVIETEAGAAIAPTAAPAAAPAEAPKTEASHFGGPAVAPTLVQPTAKPQGGGNGQSAPAAAVHAPSVAASDRFYSPLVRSIAAQEKIGPDELASIPGTGKSGRVTKRDILAYLATRSAAPSAPAAPAPVAAAPAAASAPAVQYDFGSDGITREPMDRMRKLIAKHMIDSLRTSAHVTSVSEVDLNTIVNFREKHKGAFQKKHGFKLTYTPFFAQAVTQALQEFPWVNGSVDGDKVVVRNFVNLGMAVALEQGKGLIVPVIKNAQDLNLVGLGRAVDDLASRARTKALAPEEVQTGTFTITNPGIFGNIIGSPIINQPQVAILGIGAIKKRAVVVNDAIAIRPIVYLSLAYDHRIIDGALGGMFLQRVCELLETFDPNTSI